jgi:hypothetical protein
VFQLGEWDAAAARRLDLEARTITCDETGQGLLFG